MSASIHVDDLTPEQRKQLGARASGGAWAGRYVTVGESAASEPEA